MFEIIPNKIVFELIPYKITVNIMFTCDFLRTELLYCQ